MNVNPAEAITGPTAIHPARFTTYSSTISVFRESQNYPGLVEIEITDDDSDGCGTPAFASIAIDTTQIDALIESLQAAKKLAEIGLDEYNAGKG
jgi:hypothetical protein